MTSDPLRVAPRLQYRAAIREALRDAMIADDRVFLMGEDVGRYGGCFGVSTGLLEEFGPERVRDTPLSELAFVGAGIGAALGGLRPIVEVMTVNFSLLALDQIVNNAATIPHMSGGQFAIPLVIRMTTGGGRQLAAQHSHSLEGWYAHIPGLKVLAPGTVEDARGMLAPALADPNPVLIFEHASLYNREEELAEEPVAVDISSAAVRRAGRDVSLITYGGSLPMVMDAARSLSERGIDAEVVDLRVLRPLPEQAIMDTVGNTHRVVVVDEGWRSGSLSAEVSARIMEHAFYQLDAPVQRVCSAEVPMPYAKHLEDAALPSAADVVEAAASLVKGTLSVSDFLMPSLGADMEAGTLLRWHVTPGDTVRRGDVVATVDTEKAAIDVEIWESGTIAELLVSEGEQVPVGTPLARVTSDVGEAVAPAPQSAAAPVAQQAAEAAAGPARALEQPVGAPEAPVPRSVATPGPAEARLRVTPLARVAAAELGIDLTELRGTGADGAITRADVERAAHPSADTGRDSAEPALQPAGIGDRAASLRRAIAAAMTRSHMEIPHYYLSMEVDLTRALDWLERTNRERPPEERLIPAVLFVKAVALAVRDIPEMNGHWIDGVFRPAQRCNVGFAVAIPGGGGLVAPALLDADTRSLPVLMAELRELVGRTRAGTLRSSEFGDSTITVTSLGERGRIGAVFGLINPPQVALVGLGSIAERPWAENGMLAVRNQVTVSFSGDHRVSDGHRGALFLAAVDRHLQQPELL